MDMKIAVVGSGISGLATALILSSRYEVHLFESDSRLGGHAHTVNIKQENESIPMDTGFLVYNTITYPHFTRFLDYLGVKTVASDMTLAIQSGNGFEWAGTNLSTVFAQKKNLFNFKFLLMIKDILAFNREAEANLELAKANRWTLAELAKYRNLSESFLTWYLLPMTGAIWSMSYSQAMQFPAETFLTFCINHHLLQVNNRPIWRTIENGSINYVEKVKQKIKHIHTSAAVRYVKPSDGKLLVGVNNQDLSFDKVVLATHAPISCQMVKDSLPDWYNFLSVFSTNKNEVILHKDSRVMPKKRICWSSWNVSARENAQDKQAISLTYYLNKLQPLKTATDFFITLNSQANLEFKVQSFEYDHPQFDFAAIDQQRHIPSIQGRNGIYIAGAWTRYGFHEDGILSAVKVGELLGCKPPWA